MSEQLDKADIPCENLARVCMSRIDMLGGDRFLYQMSGICETDGGGVRGISDLDI